MKKILRKFFTWAANKLSSKPNEQLIHQSLSTLYEQIQKRPNGEAGLIEKRTGKLLQLNILKDKVIILSDQHKGAGDKADDFRNCEKNYAAALNYYYHNEYTFINLGDCEELWENKAESVFNTYKESTLLEAAFHKANRYYKIFGNHDLLWFDQFAVKQYLNPFFDNLKVYEGILLESNFHGKKVHIMLAHGHQGDTVSDSNAFSKWFVGRVWVPIQRWLNFNVNTPAKDFKLSDKHNKLMYEWTLKHENLILITGHTHKPVFQSLNLIQSLNKKIKQTKQGKLNLNVDSLETELKRAQLKNDTVETEFENVIRPTYYNTGCCCFSDGDITGIEIANGSIQLIKWHLNEGISTKKILEKASMEKVVGEL